MTKKEDVSSNLRPHRIRNDHADLNKVTVMIQETMNPFDVNLGPDKLYNIGRGLTAMESTQNFLLNVFKNAENERKDLLKNARKTLDGLKNLSKRNCVICYTNWETENHCIRRKSFISILNTRFVWEHFIHTVTKEG